MAYGTVYKQAAVYVLLHGLGFSFQRAHGKYPERDETRREKAKVNRLLRKIEK
ncbi:MAG: winged helix-turn-helix domain-containing protein [Dysgonamonadaceae bacterium]|jgi:transposase|nr:winged helix-turn-helix domain-containing protein [Dysgonamonadaceae bacterium]